MAHVDERPSAETLKETLNIVTPDTVPEWVDCFISKRSIRGAEARYVEYKGGKMVWVHQRFLGEEVAADADDDFDEFDAAYDELVGDEEEAADAAPADAPADEETVEE